MLKTQSISRQWYPSRWLILVAMVCGFLMPQCTGGAQEKTKESPKVSPALMQKRWADMNTEEKQTVLTAIIQSDQDPYKSQRQALEAKIMEVYRSQMKLPETLEFEDRQGKWVKDPGFISQSQIKSVEDGTLTISGKHRANNEDGQKVGGTYSFTYKFDGQSLTVIDSSVK